MTDDELENLLDGGHETQAFEVKGVMAWNCAKLAKDILALANYRDGGHIVIGISDQTFVRQGVDESTKNTYEIEQMCDQMTRYADPHVDINISFPRDRSGREYVAIEVSPFREIPVICRSDGVDTRAGVIYYRNSNRRVESAPISNSYDMRDVIMTAVARSRARLEGIGLTLNTNDRIVNDKLDQELGGL